MVKFKEFQISDWFNFESGGEIRFMNLPKGDLPLISSRQFDNGIRRYIRKEDANKIFKGGRGLTINERGTIGLCYYQPYDFALDSVNTGYIEPIDGKTPCSKNILLYVATSIMKQRYKFSYGHVLAGGRIKSLKIELPIDCQGQPDWDYMNEYMQQIEAKYVQQTAQQYQQTVQTYQQVIKPDVLSDNETENVLKQYQNADFKKFRIGDLFEKLDTSCLLPGKIKNYVSNQKHDEYQIPLLNAKVGNNGIMYWCKKNTFKTYSNCIGVVSNGAVAAGLCYLYSSEIGCFQDAYLIKLKKNNPYRNDALVNAYLLTNIQKITFASYSYTLKAVWSRVQNDKVKLPVTVSGDPDFTLMSNYIKVIQQRYVDKLQTDLNHRLSMYQSLL